MAVTTNPLNALLYYLNGHQDWRWNFTEAEGTRSLSAGVGEAVRLTFSFPTVKPAYATEAGFQALGTAEKAAVRGVLREIEKVCNIDFVEVSGTGDMTFAYANFDFAAGYANVPSASYHQWSDGLIDDVGFSARAGDVWISSVWNKPGDNWNPGGFGFEMLLHEVGHALGLKHPHEGGSVLPPALDHSGNTVMSYQVAPQTVVWKYDGIRVDASYQGASTPLVMDIRALQFLYGANTAGNGGNTVYRWQQNEELLETIWDGNGVDTIDCSNQVLDCTINLNPGSYCSIAERKTNEQILGAMGIPSNYTVTPDVYRGKNNVGIAVGAVIENATGGSGNDRVIGNGVANRLLGGAGNDVLTGGRGRDTLSGGAGSDVFDFNSKSELGTLASATDLVLDFVRGADRLDLAGIDANQLRSGNQPFTFIGTRTFATDATGQLRMSGGVLYGSTDRDRTPEIAIKLAGVTSLDASDIIA